MAIAFKPCAVTGCKGNAHHQARGERGWCSKHYQRWRRSGDPAGKRTDNGEPFAYLIAHMWDDCPKWPFYRHACGYGEMTYQGRRGQRVHRIVCEMVNGPPPTPEHEAAHNCGKGHEGCFGARCLEWKTRIENVRDAQRHGTWSHGETVPQHILKEDQVLAILAAKPKKRDWGAATRIAKEYGVASQTITDIWRGRTWVWLTGVDAYV